MDHDRSSRSALTAEAESPIDEASLLEAIAEGRFEEALTGLMSAYGEAIHRFCQHQLGDRSLADDVHQMTFVQAYEGLGRFARRSSLKTWLYAIARHRCLDAAKAKRRWRRRFELRDQLPEAANSPSEAAETRAVTRSFREVLRDCLARLAPATRAAVLLRYREDLTYPEMAVAFEEKPATLQARVARALPALRTCLEEHGVQP